MNKFKTTGLGLAMLWLLTGCSGGGSSGGLAGDQGESPDPGAFVSAPPMASQCRGESWIGGTTEICGGILTYRDYVYDDHGADTNPTYNSPIGSLSPRSGDATYPPGAENTADLVKLELGIEGGELVVTAELNTLFESDSTLLAVAIDTDNDPATGGGEWPGLDIDSTGWDWLEIIDTGDPDTNLMTGRFALPEGDTWRVQAVVAQADGTVMNVAYRGTDEEAKGLTADGLTAGTWWEDRQAAALGAGDISQFGHTVAVADLTGGVTRFDEVEPGFHQRVYLSQFTLPPGEGVDPDGVPGRHGDTGNPCEQYFNFLGKYQPYGLYIPDADGPHGLQLVMHGCNANHASLINNSGMQQVFGEGQNRILVVPLGRGPVGFYSDISERDVLDALADVLANYPVDEDQVFSGGYSMGGYGGLRFAALYPQLFAGLVNWVGFTGDIFNTPIPGNPIPPITSGQGSTAGAVGNVIEFVGNLRHIPSANLYSGEDELVHVNTALALMQTFANADGVPYEFFLHPVAEHLTYALLDDWQKEAAYSAGRTRVDNPQRVTYRSDESLRYPEYDIRHDRAYWISDIVGRDAGFIDIDLTSNGCGGEIPVYATGNNVGPDPVPWVSQFREQSGAESLAQANRIEGSLDNVASLNIDVTGACLSSGLVEYDLTTDGPTIVNLSDGRSLSLGAAGGHQGVF